MDLFKEEDFRGKERTGNCRTKSALSMLPRVNRDLTMTKAAEQAHYNLIRLKEKFTQWAHQYTTLLT